MVPVPYVGPFGTAAERVGTFYYSRKQKREILGDAGLQHVESWALEAVARAAPFPIRAGHWNTGL